jgi:CRISPR/Cas system CSM-associated protein Csm3 (group 7 of RAMP superfamily)
VSNYNLVLFLKLKTEKKLLVSSGTVGLAPHANKSFIRVIRNGKVNLMIPGSTVKGVLRTTLLRMAELLGYHSVEKSVYPSRLGASEDIACKLFGKPHGFTSKVSVRSIYLPNCVERLTHVKIRDNNRIAEPEGLFTAEYLPIGTSFEVVMRGEDLTLEEAEALFVSIAGLKYERIGSAGVVDAVINLKKSMIPEELARRSRIIQYILEVMA